MDDLTIYNLITPNDDGSNDYWNIRGIEEYPDNKVVIFNRWGDKIGEFIGYDNKNVRWEGTNKDNELLPGGTFFYILEIQNVGSRSGWIYLRSSNE
jgi:gliding motility-associated-like protein